MNHQFIYQQDRETFRDETHHSRTFWSRRAVTQTVTGYRAASYSITNNSLCDLDEFYDARFHYDSSIFPVKHDFYGIPDAERFIHDRETPSGASIIEFPPTTARLLGRNIPASGGGYFRLYPYAFSRWLLRQVEAEGEPFVFYLHPWEVDPDQPRVKVGLKSRFRHYNNLEKCLPRMRRLLADFRFVSMRQVVDASQRVDQGIVAPA